MPLTQDNLTTFKRKFEAHEHEFLNERAYISEEAITDRIEEVDANWTLEILSKTARQTFGRDVSIIVTVRLTICGTSRDGVGTTKVAGKTGEWKDKYKKNKSKATDWIEFAPEDHTEVNEAEKSAATDALKRAARLFGIGRYLLAVPKWVVDGVQMAAWLNGGEPVENAATSPQKRETPSQRTNTSKSSENGATGVSGGWWTDNTAIQQIVSELNTSPGKAASTLKKKVTDFTSATELIDAYKAKAS